MSTTKQSQLPVASLSPGRTHRFKPFPGAGGLARGMLRPRHQLGGAVAGSSRTQILISQVSHDAHDVQRAAIQELSLLASTSDSCRTAILAANGDKTLLRVLRHSESPVLLRWSLATLSALAVDEWSRRRQKIAVERAFSICGHDHEDDEGGSPSDSQRVVLEAACLLANLTQAKEPREVFERCGGMAQLLAWSDVDDDLLEALQTAGLVPRTVRKEPFRHKPRILGSDATESPPAIASEPLPGLSEQLEQGKLLSDEEMALLRSQHAREQLAGGKLLSDEEMALLRSEHAREQLADGKLLSDEEMALLRSEHAREQGTAAQPEIEVVPPESEVTLEAEAAVADDAVAAAIKVQASIRGRQVRAHHHQQDNSKTTAAQPEIEVVPPESEAALEAEAAAADDAVAAAIKVQASIRGRQVRARNAHNAASPPKSLEATMAEEVAADAAIEAADAAVDAAVRVQASVRGRQVRARKAEWRRELLTVLFKACDVNNSGALTRPEFQQLFAKADNTSSVMFASILFGQADTSGDDKLTSDEFVALYLEQLRATEDGAFRVACQKIIEAAKKVTVADDEEDDD
jgi:uncharacterized protein YajQ (UPF0234 family)